MKTDINKRLDGRRANEIRPIAMEQGFLHQADGSARFSMGKTSVLVGVFGPTAHKFVRQQQPFEATVTASFKSHIGVSGPTEIQYQTIVQDVYRQVINTKAYPRALIDISVQVIEDDGSVLSAALNAANLALMDAGIEMTGFVSSVTCSLYSSGKLCLDPSLSEQLNEVVGTIIYAGDCVNEGVLASISSGLMTDEQYFSCAEGARRGVDSVYSFVRLGLSQKFEKELSAQ